MPFVYRFDVLAKDRLSWLRSPFAATLQAIRRHGWRPVEESGRQVFDDAIDDDGICRRPAGP